MEIKISKLCKIGSYNFFVDQVIIKENELRLQVYSNGAYSISSMEDLEDLHTMKLDIIGIQEYDFKVNGRSLVLKKDLT